MDHGTNANENGNIGMERHYAVHRLCAKRVPENGDVALSIVHLTIGENGAMAFEVAASADAFGSVVDGDLPKASIAVEGACEANESAFATDALVFEFGAASASGLSVAAVPKKVSGATPSRFFVRTTAE